VPFAERDGKARDRRRGVIGLSILAATPTIAPAAMAAAATGTAGFRSGRRDGGRHRQPTRRRARGFGREGFGEAEVDGGAGER
jgi:hypothetical protein